MQHVWCNLQRATRGAIRIPKVHLVFQHLFGATGSCAHPRRVCLFAARRARSRRLLPRGGRIPTAGCQLEMDVERGSEPATAIACDGRNASRAPALLRPIKTRAEFLKTSKRRRARREPSLDHTMPRTRSQRKRPRVRHPSSRPVKQRRRNAN